ncbi:hypothetical protein CHUAL_006765 [Chamberlinius hualienensis]
MSAVFIVLLIFCLYDISSCSNDTTTLPNFNNLVQCPLPCLNTSSFTSATDCTCYTVKDGWPSALWTKGEVTTSLDADFPIEVQITPLRRGNDDISVNCGLRSALNINFIIKNPSIKGIGFRFSQECCTDSKNCSKYYDLSSANTSVVGKALYSNDLKFTTVKHDDNCDLEIGTIHSVADRQYRWMKVKYSFKVLNPMNIYDKDITLCTFRNEWKSLILIEISSYDTKEKSLWVRFSTAPPKFQVYNYKLVLLNVDTEIVGWTSKSLNVSTPNAVVRVFNVEFSTNYILQLFILDKECQNSSNSSVINIQPSPEYLAAEYKHYVLKLILLVFFGIVVAVVAFFSILIGIYVHRRRIYETKPKLKLFLVYNRDIDEHIKVVEQLTDYLQYNCHCEVLVDYRNIQLKDPFLWIDHCLAVADFVLVIWSRGAQLKIQTNNRKKLGTDEGFLGNDNFSNCLAKINDRIQQEITYLPFTSVEKRRFINIILPYTPKNCQLPPCLEYMVRFHLPKEFGPFICHIHHLLPRFFCHPFSQRFYPDQESFSGKKRLLNAISTMNKLENEGKWYLTEVAVHQPDRLLSIDSNDSSVLSYESELVTAESEIDEEAEMVLQRDFPPNAQDVPEFCGHYSDDEILQNRTDHNEDRGSIEDHEFLFGPQ